MNPLWYKILLSVDVILLLQFFAISIIEASKDHSNMKLITISACFALLVPLQVMGYGLFLVWTL